MVQAVDGGFVWWRGRRGRGGGVVAEGEAVVGGLGGGGDGGVEEGVEVGFEGGARLEFSLGAAGVDEDVGGGAAEVVGEEREEEEEERECCGGVWVKGSSTQHFFGGFCFWGGFVLFLSFDLQLVFVFDASIA